MSNKVNDELAERAMEIVDNALEDLGWKVSEEVRQMLFEQELEKLNAREE